MLVVSVLEGNSWNVHDSKSGFSLLIGSTRLLFLCYGLRPMMKGWISVFTIGTAGLVGQRLERFRTCIAGKFGHCLSSFFSRVLFLDPRVFPLVSQLVCALID